MPTCPTCNTNILVNTIRPRFSFVNCPKCKDEFCIDGNGNISGTVQCSGCIIKNPLTGGHLSCHAIPGYHDKPKIDWGKMPNGERISSVEELGGICLGNTDGL